MSGHPYGFPFAPYAIQRDFCHAVHACLDEGAVALLESPTGTGKTMSLICGTLSWLQTHQFAATATDTTPPPSDPLERHLWNLRR